MQWQAWEKPEQAAWMRMATWTAQTSGCKRGPFEFSTQKRFCAQTIIKKLTVNFPFTCAIVAFLLQCSWLILDLQQLLGWVCILRFRIMIRQKIGRTIVLIICVCLDKWGHYQRDLREAELYTYSRAFKKHSEGWKAVCDLILQDASDVAKEGRLCKFYLIWKLQKEVWKHSNVLKDSLDLTRIRAFQSHPAERLPLTKFRGKKSKGAQQYQSVCVIPLTGSVPQRLTKRQ